MYNPCYTSAFKLEIMLHPGEESTISPVFFASGDLSAVIYANAQVELQLLNTAEEITYVFQTNPEGLPGEPEMHNAILSIPEDGYYYFKFICQSSVREFETCDAEAMCSAKAIITPFLMPDMGK